MTHSGKILNFLTIGVLLLLAGCGSQQPYDVNTSNTQVIGNDLVRYGAIGAGGAAGYYIGDKLGNGNPLISGLGAATGAGLVYALEKFDDKGKLDAYNVGLQQGAAEARQELLNDKWKREAVYGLPPDDASGYGAPVVRNVYVPTRVINGVVMQGGYEQVILR